MDGIKKVITGVALVLSCTLAQALPILDQQSTNLDIQSYSSGTAMSVAWQQGVTVGISGQLTSLGFYASETGTNVFNIYAGGPWQTSGALATVNGTVTTVGWNSIDLSSAAIFFNAGEEFTWGVSKTGSGFDMAGSASNAGAYDGGIAVFAETFYLAGEFDLAFRSFMDPDAAVVPEPTALALFGFGLIGVVISRRRRG